nr:putative ribonuclease H-like domain-containing protein [Tanacetum cinerariifolium]
METLGTLGVRPIGTKWVLKTKKDEWGIVIRNKARLVAQGYTQEKGVDYEEVFAPVARIEAIWLFLAYASFMGFTVYQMDVKHTFLYGTINEEVYVMQPPRFQDPEFPGRVYNVEKAIEFEELMHKKFQMSAMGELTFFLGLQVLQKKDGIILSQDKYVGDILKKFRYSDVRSANTHMDKENPWGKDGPGKDVELHLYRSMIGSLMYLTASRPDIMFVVSACARHQVTPKECHLHVVKRILRYLKGHPKLGLWYPKDSPFDLVTYSDSNYGGATQDRKSTTRGCQFLGRRLISWQCKKQTIVATSTTEAEYVAAASGSSKGLMNSCMSILFLQVCMRYTRRATWIAQSKALLPAANEPASLLRDDRQGEAFLTVFGLDAGHERENIIKTSALPHESSPMVTSLDVDEGSMQHKLQELMDLSTSLQLQQTQMATKIKDQDLKIFGLKERLKSLEDKDRGEAANILTSGVAAVSVSFVDGISTVGVPTVSGLFPTASAIFTTTSVVTPYTRRPRGISAKDKDKEKVMESEVKHPIIEYEIHSEGQREYWKIIRLGGHTAVYQFFVDMLKQFNREELHQLWTLMKETLSIQQATKGKEKELWVELKRLFEPNFEDQLWTHNQAFMHDPLEWKLYDTCGVHHVFTKDQEMFMLIEKDYPLRKGLATVMICNKLQVEQYS